LTYNLILTTKKLYLINIRLPTISVTLNTNLIKRLKYYLVPVHLQLITRIKNGKVEARKNEATGKRILYHFL